MLYLSQKSSGQTGIGGMYMKWALIGIAIILFAILVQLCSAGMELAAFGTGVLGLFFTIISVLKSK